MTAPAISALPPAPTAVAAGANAASSAGASAATSFQSLLGALFGDQNGLAAQLFAGAAPGEATEVAEESGDSNAAAQGLGGAFLGLPLAPPRPQTTTVATEPGEAGAPVASLAAGVGGSSEIALPGAPIGVPQPIDPDADKGAASPPGTAANLTAKAAVDAAATAVDASGQTAAKPQAAAPVEAATTKATAQVAAADNAGTPPPAAQAAVAPAPPPTKNNPPPAPSRRAGQAVTGEVGAAPTPRAPIPGLTSGASVISAAAASFAKGAEGDAIEPTLVEVRPEGGDHRPQAAPASATPLPVAAPITHAVMPVRVVSETLAHMAAQIASQLQGGSTHFDFELTPAGLGRVDVRIEISAHGQLTAAMSFDNPNAAAEMRHRAGDLARTLEQAGFDLSGGLSFDVAGDRGQAGQGASQQRGDSSEAWRGRAFQAALDVAGETDAGPGIGAFNNRGWSATGVDIRI